MIRLTLAAALALVLAVPSAGAQQRPPAGSDAGTLLEEDTGGTPLESIEEEAAIAGDGERRPADEDPMARTEAEMIESADEDGCEGSVGADCPGGDN